MALYMQRIAIVVVVVIVHMVKFITYTVFLFKASIDRTSFYSLHLSPLCSIQKKSNVHGKVQKNTSRGSAAAAAQFLIQAFLWHRKNIVS